MKKFNTRDLAALVIWVLPVAYFLSIRSSLPASIPVHFGLNGTPDRYGSVSELLTLIFILMGSSALVYLLLKFLPGIDPKKRVGVNEPTLQKIGLLIVLFFAALTIVIIFATSDKTVKIDKLLLPIAGLFFAFMGNMMHSIKPNYFAGVRTPWTLEDDETWRATHRLAGKLWFVGGIVITIAVLLLPEIAGTIFFMGILAVLILVPVVYSYTYFKKHHVK